MRTPAIFVDRDSLRREIAKLRDRIDELQVSNQELTARHLGATRHFDWRLLLTPTNDRYLYRIFKAYPEAIYLGTSKTTTCERANMYILRKKLRPHGIAVTASVGYGYRLADEDYQKLKRFVVTK